MGLVYGQMGFWEDQAGAALKKAVELGPQASLPTAHGSLALWYEKLNNINGSESRGS